MKLVKKYFNTPQQRMNCLHSVSEDVAVHVRGEVGNLGQVVVLLQLIAHWNNLGVRPWETSSYSNL